MAELPDYAVQRGWGPEYLVRWLFEQDDIWVTAKGETVFLTQMDPEHALNTVLFLERVAHDLPLRRELQSYPLYQAIRERVIEHFPKPTPPQELFIARQRPGRASWAVEKVLADGSLMEWDYPLTGQEARDLAKKRNREAGQ